MWFADQDEAALSQDFVKKGMFFIFLCSAS